MAQVIADRKDIDFVLYEQLGIEALSNYDKFSDFTKKTIDLVLSEARTLAVKELLPALKTGDEEGCTFENGQVRVPEVFHKIHALFKEGEWVAMTDDPEWGGQGMPVTLSLAAQNYFNGANFPFMLHYFLTHGAGKLVQTFGTDQQKKLYLKKLYSGDWGGTMLLTEPQAGSDVGALSTTAVRMNDGTYAISGSKIFISSGENDLVENIVHPVLARIQGAPSGTAGISLFLVPKIRVNDDGSLGEFNDVVCTGVEEKMGIHGSPTCSLTLGSKGQCRGTLLGEESKGMRAMFVMMNEARLDVGIQALGCASASYMNALNYARQRVQGNALQARGTDSVPIIQHPDVRRMLLTMKTYTEGIRSLIFFIGQCEDTIGTCGDDGEKARRKGLIEVLIPIAKGYASDRAFEVCNLGVQIFGGYGYTREYPQEQLLRDSKITHIYEGTNGIQSMDLLGRKLGLNKGKAFTDLLGEMRKAAILAKKINRLAKLGSTFENLVHRLDETARHMAQILRSQDPLPAFSLSYLFLEVTGDAVMAWMLLWRASLSAMNLERGVKKKDESFYDGQIKGARFFINLVLPVTLGKMDTLVAGDQGTIMGISEDA
jgi:alkylation response protein AidB-like acyl-CoA dehydrogenase